MELRNFVAGVTFCVVHVSCQGSVNVGQDATVGGDTIVNPQRDASDDSTTTDVPRDKPDQIVLEDQKAFPSALGYGKYTAGGRGGRVLKVTNLDDGGTGSLKWALQQTFPRTIVFDVAGTIRGAESPAKFSRYAINKDMGYVTIDGATAPGRLEIQGIMLDFQTGNVIVRNLIFRNMPDGSGGSKAIRFRAYQNTPSIENCMIDRVSGYYAEDENFNVSADGIDNQSSDPEARDGTPKVSNVTFSNIITAQSKYGNLIFQKTSNISWIRVFSSLNNNRNTGFSSTGFTSKEVINCVTHHTGYAFISAVFGERSDWIGNVGRFADESITGRDASWLGFLAVSQNNSPNLSAASSHFHAADNIMMDSYVPPSSHGEDGFNQDYKDYVKPTRQMSGHITEPVPSDEVVDLVLGPKGAGATPWDRDRIDRESIANFFANTGTVKIGRVNYSDPDDFLNPPDANRPSGFDNDDDGMPDDWESSHGVSDPLGTKRDWLFGETTVSNEAQYTNLEMYLFDLNKEFE